MNHLLAVYKKLKIKPKKAKSKYIWDINNKKYLDFFSGLSVTNLGHLNPKVINNIKQTLNQYTHLSNLYAEKNQEKLAKVLIKKTIPGKVFFSNSGAEANECAIKTARQYFKGKKYEIISFKNSFHGRTLATLSATGQNKFHKNLGPMPRGFIHVQYNSLDAIKKKINNKTAAVILELIQGSQINVADKKFIKELNILCKQKNILLIIDEIQTGLGRTGKFLASQDYQIKPDIITLGKALGGGLPLGATIIRNKIAQIIKLGDHGSTFGGNPVSCAAGLAVVESINNKLLKEVYIKGKYFEAELNKLKNIKEVRGKGLMLGIEVNYSGNKLVDYLLKQGFIVNCMQDKIIRFLPPFNITCRDIDYLLKAIKAFK